jgi:hypothetical protein
VVELPTSSLHGESFSAIVHDFSKVLDCPTLRPEVNAALRQGRRVSRGTSQRWGKIASYNCRSRSGELYSSFLMKLATYSDYSFNFGWPNRRAF